MGGHERLRDPLPAKVPPSTGEPSAGSDDLADRPPMQAVLGGQRPIRHTTSGVPGTDLGDADAAAAELDRLAPHESSADQARTRAAGLALRGAGAADAIVAALEAAPP